MKAESSTIRQVRGDFVINGTSSIECITVLQFSKPSDLRLQMRGYIGERHDFLRIPLLDGSARHPVHRATLFVLGYGVAAGSLDLSEPERPIASHPGHKHSGCQRPAHTRNGIEQNVDRRLVTIHQSAVF